MTRPRTAKKTHAPMHAYAAIVTGVEQSVPFRVHVKYMKRAERLAKETCGTLTDLTTGRSRRWIKGAWEDVLY